jgi:hypothetical protein
LGKSFLILPEFISRDPSSCTVMLFDFLPFFRLVCLGECYGFPLPSLIPRCPISSYVRLIPLDFSSSLRKKRYWIRSSCSAGTLSTPYFFHCSRMFGRSMPSLSTMSLRLGSSMPTSLGVIFESLFASCIGVLASSIPPSIGLVLPPCSLLLPRISVFSRVACSLATVSFVFSFPPSSPWLALSRLSGLGLASRFLSVGALLGFLFSLFLCFGFTNLSSSCYALVFSVSCFLLSGHSLIKFPCSWHLLHLNGICS